VTWPLGVEFGVVVVVLSFVVGDMATWEVLGVVVVVMLSFVAIVDDILLSSCCQMGVVIIINLISITKKKAHQGAKRERW
jgi:hypothetical protein